MESFFPGTPSPLSSAQANTVREAIAKHQAAATTPDVEPCTVRRDPGECHGYTGNTETHGMAHCLLNKFQWFEQVCVSKRGGTIFIDVVHAYPPEVRIIDYMGQWARVEFKTASGPMDLGFMTMAEALICGAVR